MRLKQSESRLGQAGNSPPAAPSRDLRGMGCAGHSIDWFRQIAVMSNPLRPTDRLEASLEAFQEPVALATAANDVAESTLVSANKAFVRASGWSSQELQGRRLSDCDAALIDLRPLFDRNGQRRHWLVIHHVAEQKDGSGKPKAAADKTTAAETTAADDGFRALVESIPNGVLVHRNFRPLYANRACAQRIGFDSGAELVAEPTLLPFLPIEMHNRAVRRHQRILEGGDPGPARVLRCLTRSGAPFWMEATEERIVWQGEPAVLVSLSDVTDQVQMRRTELMLREAVDNLSDSFVLYDSDLKILLTNRRFHELFPFLPAQHQIVGKPMQELVEASVANNVVTDPRVWRDREQFIADFIADRRTNEISISEDAWPDGRWDLVKEQHTRSGGFVSVRTDITERKRAEFALR
ncbi:MAG TPA: PAS domain S-box protein, partial [Kiloniellaceae bacterium]|nr:PAS domain S-box protein [Kiloniellaceae bacterium]